MNINCDFVELSDSELYSVDGGFVWWAFAIGVAVGACFTAGGIYGYKKESQGK